MCFCSRMVFYDVLGFNCLLVSNCLPGGLGFAGHAVCVVSGSLMLSWHPVLSGYRVPSGPHALA